MFHIRRKIRETVIILEQKKNQDIFHTIKFLQSLPIDRQRDRRWKEGRLSIKSKSPKGCLTTQFGDIVSLNVFN